MGSKKRYFSICILLIMTILTGCLGNSSRNTSASSADEKMIEKEKGLPEETEQNSQMKDLGEDVKLYREKR